MVILHLELGAIDLDRERQELTAVPGVGSEYSRGRRSRREIARVGLAIERAALKRHDELEVIRMDETRDQQHREHGGTGLQDIASAESRMHVRPPRVAGGC